MQIRLTVVRKKVVNKLVHHLVAAAIFPNPDNLPEINHKNRIRNDNRAENLEWISKDGNRAQRHLRPSDELNGNRTVVWKCDKKTGKRLESYRSLMDAAKAVNSKWAGAICNVVKGRQLTAHGFKWILEEQDKIENEIWKPLFSGLVDGADGNFISSEGRIKNKAGTVRRGYDHSSGYKRVCISNKNYCVHRLVAQTFLPNFFGKSIVNHRDSNKKNPRLYNLEWSTPAENTRHAHDTGLISTRRAVRQFAVNGTIIADFRSIAEAIQATGSTYLGIQLSITRHTLSGSSRWTYIEGGETPTLPKFAGRVRPIRQWGLDGI
jgi:hypothetical protein